MVIASAVPEVASSDTPAINARRLKRGGAFILWACCAGAVTCTEATPTKNGGKNGASALGTRTIGPFTHNGEWTMQQLREAFPWDQAPRYVLRDRDAIYGRDFIAMTRDMGIEEVLTAPRSPWQNPFAERLVGSIRRECLDHVLVWNSRSLRRTLQRYFAY